MNSTQTPLEIPVITNRQDVLEMIQNELESAPVTLVRVAAEDFPADPAQEARYSCVLVEVTNSASADLQLIADLHVRQPRVQIIAVSCQWQVTTAVQAIKSGAIEICDLPSRDGMLRNSIQQTLFKDRHSSRQFHELIPHAILEKLSSEEAKILHMLIQGRTTKEVGATLDVSVRTIHYRKKTLLQKLGVRNRSEAIEMIRIANGSMMFY